MNKNTLLLILGLLLISFVSALSVDENTVALWNLDEGSGISVLDATGNENDGTIIGGATWTTDSVSEFALNFDGIDDYVSITKTSSLDVINEMTLEASVKRTSNADGMVFSRNGPYYLAVRNNVISGGVFAGSWWEELSGTTPLEQNVWYNLKLTYDGENLNLYVNDVLDASVPKTGQMMPWSQQGYIGYGEPGQNQYFTGIIDEVRISNIARTNEPSEPSLEERVTALEDKIVLLENRVSVLETLVDKIMNYFFFMPQSLKKDILCNTMKGTGQTQIQDLGLKCKLNPGLPTSSKNWCICTPINVKNK